MENLSSSQFCSESENVLKSIFFNSIRPLDHNIDMYLSPVQLLEQSTIDWVACLKKKKIINVLLTVLEAKKSKNRHWQVWCQVSAAFGWVSSHVRTWGHKGAH